MIIREIGASLRALFTRLSSKTTTIAGTETVYLDDAGSSVKAALSDAIRYGGGNSTRVTTIGNANISQKSDGTMWLEVTGQTAGNSRGAGAFDWQAQRGAGAQVASGTSATCFGARCTAQNYGFASGADTTASIYGAAFGNNQTSPLYGAVFGRANSQFWDGAVVFGYSPSLNRGGAIASLTAITTDGTTAVPLFCQSATERPTVNAKRCVAFTGLVTASTQSGTATYSKAWEIKGLIERNNAGTTSLVGTPIITLIGVDADAGGVTPSTWALAITADDTNDALAISATGQASTTINWHSTLLVSQSQGS